ncbi:MAG: metallopeptidase family protein [Phycisphaerae bacterium]|nr:metallopeptidase family protein [Phycisphaerae bacterium]
MNSALRDRFDRLVEDAIEALPPHVRELLDECPVVVLDEPDARMLKDLGIDPADTVARDELCGLHTGIAGTERGIEQSGDLPPVIHLFRRGIVSLAGGWDQEQADEAVYDEIWITLLHEIGHQFGLDEDDLERLGYD